MCYIMSWGEDLSHVMGKRSTQSYQSRFCSYPSGNIKNKYNTDRVAVVAVTAMRYTDAALHLLRYSIDVDNVNHIC